MWGILIGEGGAGKGKGNRKRGRMGKKAGEREEGRGAQGRGAGRRNGEEGEGKGRMQVSEQSEHGSTWDVWYMVFYAVMCNADGLDACYVDSALVLTYSFSSMHSDKLGMQRGT